MHLKPPIPRMNSPDTFLDCGRTEMCGLSFCPHKII